MKRQTKKSSRSKGKSDSPTRKGAKQKEQGMCRSVAKSSAKHNTASPTAAPGDLVERIVAILDQSRGRIARTVNSEIVLAYWHIGREIVEYVQGGASRAGYGDELLQELSEQLNCRFGRGYSVTNLKYFRLFFQSYRDR